MTARWFADANAEADFVQSSSERFRQIKAIGDAADARQTAINISAHYRKYPWTNPGLAKAFATWRGQYGTEAAKSLSRVAANADKGEAQQDLEQYAMTQEFKRQVKQKDDSGGFWEQLDDIVLKPVTAPVRFAQSVSHGDLGGAAGALFDITPLGTAKEIAEAEASLGSHIPGVKPVARAGFTAIESPYQEVQGAASRALVGLAQAVGATGQGVDTEHGFTSAVRSYNQGAAQGLDALHNATGLTVPADQTIQPVSTGAIALENLLSGKPVDLGTGYFPGGEVYKEHVKRVQDIGYFTYGEEPVLNPDGTPKIDANGDPVTTPTKHFATPGRIVASLVSEPGTRPFTALSGLVDAAAIVKADPVNPALAFLGDVNQARQGFDLARDAELEAAGGFRNTWRTFTHGPTVTQYLDSDKGAKVLSAFANEDDFLRLARATNFKIPAKAMTDIVDAQSPEEVRGILEPLLGVAVQNQPNPNALGAHIRQATQPLRILNIRPEQTIDLNMLDGDGGAISNVYRWMKNAKVPDEQISPVLKNLAAVRAAPGQYEALKQGAGVVEATLFERGVPANEAHDLTRLFTDDIADGSRYWIDQIADNATTPGVLVDGRSFPTDKPHLYVEHLSSQVSLPNVADINQSLARYGRILGIKGTGAVELDAARTVTRYKAGEALLKGRYAAYMSNALLTHIQSSVWVPLTLLRGAWTIRVVGEEQLRMAASELDSLFHHPISHIITVTHRKGDRWAGANGENLLDTNELQASLSQQGGTFIGDAAGQRVIAKGKKNYSPGMKQFESSWADELVKQHSDPIMGAVARAVRKGSELPQGELTVAGRFGMETRAVGPLGDVKNQFWDGNLAEFRQNLAESKNFSGGAVDLTRRETVNGVMGSDDYIESLYQRLHDMTGGHGPLVDFLATGKYGDAATFKQALRGREVVAEDGLHGFVVSHRPGSNAAQVMWNGAEGSVKENVDNLVVADTSPVKTLTRAHDGVRADKDFIEWLRGMPTEVKPSRVVGDVIVKGQEHTKILDTITRGLFAGLMTYPTNYLSRAPAFRGFYWRHAEEMMPLADKATQGMILEGAARAKVGRQTVRRLQKIADSGAAGELTMQELDEMVKGRALDSVQDLLYDLNRRSQFFDATRLLFPFGEAWKEVLTRWARIPVEHPKSIRGFQVGVDGLRGANPLAVIPGAVPDQYEHQGFFAKNPSTGQESFVYPFSAEISDKLIGLPFPQTGSAQGLNLAFNVVPGVGLAAQIPAGMFMDRYMQDPKWDDIRDIVFPYGEPDVTKGPWLFAPAWMQKLWTGSVGPAGEENARLLNNTIAEVWSYGRSVGDYKADTIEHIQQGWKDAESKAKDLYKLRAGFQWGGPSAPSPQFMVEAKSGRLMQLQMLRDEYHRLQGKDYSTATAKYLNRFGEKALYAVAPLTESKSYAIPLTDTALEWTRTHPDVRTNYPTVYGFFAPQGGKQDYNAYLRAIATDELTPTTDNGVEWVKRTNHVLGNMWYDQVRAKIGLKAGESGSAKQRSTLSDFRDLIRKEYPGWRDISFEPSKIPHAIEELDAASKDKSLQTASPALTESISAYMAARQKAIGVVESSGGNSEFGSPGFGTAKKYTGLRNYLRDVAKTIIKVHPEFEPIWEQVFSRELPDDEG